MDLCKIYSRRSFYTTTLELVQMNFRCRLHSRWLTFSQFSFNHCYIAPPTESIGIDIHSTSACYKSDKRLISTYLTAPLVKTSIYKYQALTLNKCRSLHSSTSIIEQRRTVGHACISVSFTNDITDNQVVHNAILTKKLPVFGHHPCSLS